MPIHGHGEARRPGTAVPDSQVMDGRVRAAGGGRGSPPPALAFGGRLTREAGGHALRWLRLGLFSAAILTGRNGGATKRG